MTLPYVARNGGFQYWDICMNNKPQSWLGSTVRQPTANEDCFQHDLVRYANYELGPYIKKIRKGSMQFKGKSIMLGD